MNTGSSKERSIELPSWEEATAHVKGGTANALEKFIHHQEPAVFCGEDEFRAQLLDVLKQERGFWESEACQCIKCSADEPSAVHITIEANRDEAVSDLEMRLQMAHERIAQLVSSSQPPPDEREDPCHPAYVAPLETSPPPNASDKCGYCGSSEFECIHCAARRTAQPPPDALVDLAKRVLPYMERVGWRIGHRLERDDLVEEIRRLAATKSDAQ
jgi:hypothetical protein